MWQVLEFIGSVLKWGALLLALMVGWTVFVIAEGEMKLFWTVSRPHYKLSFAIQTPDGVYSAQTVVEVEYTEIPPWEVIPILSMGEGFCCHAVLKGRGAALRLPDGKAVSMLITNSFGTFDDNRIRYDVRKIADELLTKDPKIPFAPPAGDPRPGQRVIDAHTGSLVHGGSDIPLDLMPPMIVFTDADNSHTAQLFDPANPERWLGPGVKFLGARIDVTQEPVGSDIKSVLPWLEVPQVGDSIAVFRYEMAHPVITKGDPFLLDCRACILDRNKF
jgi:hypothetical protein